MTVRYTLSTLCAFCTVAFIVGVLVGSHIASAVLA